MLRTNLLVNSCVKRVVRRAGVRVLALDTDDDALMRLEAEVEKVEVALAGISQFLYDFREAKKSLAEERPRRLW